MVLQVYNTLTRKKEPFPKKPGEPVGMYVCGPTVYKPSHIGHMVGPVVFDTVKRYLTYLGYRVTWVVNVTDVDDKLIKRAGELNLTVPELAGKMTADYLACLTKLNVTGVDHFPKATEHVPAMTAMIARLVETGYAYPAGGDVYFDVSKDPDYGKLCGFDPEQLEAGSRVEVSDRKRNPGDFALWKGAKPGEPAEVQFDSPWGKGRPGWHIECSAMCRAIFGDTIDVHGGGLDLRFPHHENELAQSESATGKPFARVWMHNGLLSLGQKMAGSVGNVLNVADALTHVSGEVLRFFVLQTHYRSPIDVSDWKPGEQPVPPGLEAAKRAYGTFLRFAERVERATGAAFADVRVPGDARATLSLVYADYHRKFRDFMNDDFNTGGAVGVLFEMVTALNKVADAGRLDDPAKADPVAKAEFTEGAGVVKEIAAVLGLTFVTRTTRFAEGIGAVGTHLSVQGEGSAVLSGPALEQWNRNQEVIDGLMRLLLELRDNLRATAKGITDKADPTKQALFAQTDLIRKRLGELGVTLEDGPGGTRGRVG